MTKERAIRLVAACALAATAAPGASAAPQPAPPPVRPCTHFAASAAFATDGTAFCAGHVRAPSSGATTSIAVFRTTDGGRSWATVPAAGLVPSDPYARVTHLSISPSYKTDGAVFVQLGSSGLYQSTDRGTTFSLVGPLAWSRLTAYAATAPGGILGSAGVHPLFVMARPPTKDGEPNQSAIVDPLARAQTPVLGTPGRDTAFAVPDTFGKDGVAFAVADHGGGLDAHVGIYRCNAAFACSEPLRMFPKRWTFDRIWLSPGFASTKTLYVSMTTLDGKRSLWWSRDAGKTWKPWTSAERLLAPVVRAQGSPAFALGAGPAGSRLLYLRLSYAAGTAADPPAEQLFRSSDAGATWQRVAYGRSERQRGTRGTMPTDSPMYEVGDGRSADGLLTVTSNGRVFALGTTWSDHGFYCSWDAGRSWARYCR